ncbi:MAG: hypothetical protein CO126_10440 [Hydrogenophilales bacterium CG_4_9_14_3_um_filter_63_34]|nr:MAG: hypothetical protein COZ24_08050 [Hydrogenophilales bacterium CG_4_10_14_3_um_filter_63_21]PJB02736.1 MAG: hypothetical protein CO126_10440 [Hydrogenophilales bacterium CG_4_9_14_3_um_filter_63_34]
MNRISLLLAATAVLTIASPSALAAQPGSALLDTYHAAAMKEEPGFRDFSARRGEQFFHAKHGDTSCASCHTDNPKAGGKHAKTGKAIEPLAPVANAKRLSDAAKVEKWFKRNCNDVLQRACTAREKGDFVAWLVSVK